MCTGRTARASQRVTDTDSDEAPQWHDAMPDYVITMTCDNCNTLWQGMWQVITMTYDL